jgi:MFS family permease
VSQGSGRPPLTATFASLKNRNYRLYFGGQLTSMVGTWMQSTALSWYVLEKTHSALALGTVSTFQFLPVLLFSLFGGVIADRFPKQKLLIAMQAVLLVQATVLATLTATDLINLPLIYILAALQGTASSINMPAQQSFVMEMVGPKDVPNAVALNATLLQGTRLLGPALGGLTIALFGAAVCFYVNAASFLAVLGALLLMDPSTFFKVERPRRAAVLRQLGDGLHYAVTTPDILLAVITMAVIGTFGYNFQVFTPLIAQFVLHTNSVGFGLLSSTMAIGSLVAALGVAWLGGATRRVMLTGALCFSAALLAIGFSSTWLLLVPLLAIFGFSSSVFNATNNSRLQLITPQQLRGRVMSINTLLFAGTTPIGSLIVGVLAERYGVQPMLAMMGGACLLGVLGALLYQHRVRDRLVPEGTEVPAPLPPLERELMPASKQVG